jgi:hypothetical protein
MFFDFIVEKIMKGKLFMEAVTRYLLFGNSETQIRTCSYDNNISSSFCFIFLIPQKVLRCARIDLAK